MKKGSQKNLLVIVGPGLLVAATGVGAGDLATASLSGSFLGTAILWAAVLGAFLKFVVTEGLARWQLATGDTLIEGPGPSNSAFIPATFDRSYDNLTVTLRQELGRGVTLSLKASNLTDANRQQVYRTKYIPEDVVRRDYTQGVSYSLSIGGVIRF